MARNRVRLPRRGLRVRPVAWGCGEPGCPAYTWQPVSALGEFDPIDAAMADLNAHYATAHPELAGSEDEEVIARAHPLAA